MTAFIAWSTWQNFDRDRNNTVKWLLREADALTRELENAMERAVILTRGPRITPEDLPSSILPDIQGENTSSSMEFSEIYLKEMERKMILKTLEETGGNRTRSSDILGISRRTLQLKLKKYGVN